MKQVILDFLRGRRHAYRMVFDRENVYTEAVLKDLAKFCRAHETTFAPDARAHAVMEGRREVWLRIQAHLQLTDEEAYKLFHGKD